ncbi:MAG: SNF2-related protein, partial [Gammaproteobacteria bacterium]
METLDNVNKLFGDSLKETIQPGARLRIAAATFSIYAFEALKKELESIDSFEFLFTTPAFLPDDEQPKERREFHIPKKAQERLFYGSDFEIQLKNQLYQRAIARECADWIKRKARFRSNRTGAPMQEFACVQGRNIDVVYHPLQGFTKVGLGYEKGDAISNLMMRLEGEDITKSYLSTLDQIWSDPNKVEDVTERLREHIASVYRENDPERIYFLMLYSIFNEFLEDISEDVMPKDRTGYQDSVIWNMLFNFQRDAATGIINKLETYNGCILADSVGLGKTFSALAVIKYYETRNSRVLVLCPKKLAENWTTYTQNLTTNELEADRFNYDVLCHTDLQRDRGESLGMQLNRVNWGNYDLVVIDESHNFRNDDTYKDRETRYQRLMNKVIRAGITTKVLMLSATPVNNRFSDLRNQLALAYEGSEAKLDAKLKTERGIKEIFKRAQTAFTEWSKRAPDERTAEAILTSLDFDFFELLDSVTIARSRRHIQTFYDTSEIGAFPERLPPLSIHSDLTSRDDVIGFNDIFERLSGLRMAVYAPITYILPSRIAHYADLYDTKITGGDSRLRQADREKSLQRLMTVNLLKRLESSVHAFRLTLSSLARHHRATLDKIDAHKNLGDSVDLSDLTDALGDSEPDDDILDRFGDEEETIGSKVRINLADMDLTSFENDLNADLTVISELLAEMEKITPEHDAKLQRLMAEIDAKLASPLNPGNRKVLLFTAFADTADYLYANLHPHLETNHGLHTGKVTGKGAPASTLG